MINSSEFQFVYCENGVQNEKFADSVRELLVLCDKEFIPPLSFRNSSTQKDFSGSSQSPNEISGITLYLNDLMKQNNIFVLDGENLIAFMSFKPNHFKFPFDTIIEPNEVNNYISTLIVHPKYRRFHIAYRLYDYIENLLNNDNMMACISTRTWSTNVSHINLLKKRGYKFIYSAKNDRTDNEGNIVDTVYYLKYNYSEKNSD